MTPKHRLGQKGMLANSITTQRSSRAPLKSKWFHAAMSTQWELLKGLIVPYSGFISPVNVLLRVIKYWVTVDYIRSSESIQRVTLLKSPSWHSTQTPHKNGTGGILERCWYMIKMYFCILCFYFKIFEITIKFWKDAHKKMKLFSSYLDD